MSSSPHTGDTGAARPAEPTGQRPLPPGVVGLSTLERGQRTERRESAPSGTLIVGEGIQVKGKIESCQRLVVEAGLVEAVRSGHLAGAALDVTEEEPLAATSPLWDLPGVIITPHVGGQSALRIDNITNMFCQNLTRRQTGRPLVNYLADKRLGFPIRGGETPIWGRSEEHTSELQSH